MIDFLIYFWNIQENDHVVYEQPLRENEVQILLVNIMTTYLQKNVKDVFENLFC